MSHWTQASLALLVAVILANPLCICSAEPVPAPVAKPSCCGGSEPDPDNSLPIAPCDCVETALSEGLPVVQDPLGSRPLTAANSAPPLRFNPPGGQPAIVSTARSFPIHGPPKRHLLSIYRL